MPEDNSSEYYNKRVPELDKLIKKIQREIKNKTAGVNRPSIQYWATIDPKTNLPIINFKGEIDMTLPNSSIDELKILHDLILKYGKDITRERSN